MNDMPTIDDLHVLLASTNSSTIFLWIPVDDLW